MKRNGNAKRRRRENRGAEGVEPQARGSRRRRRRGCGVWGGGVPSHRGRGWGGEKLLILALNTVSFGAFQMVFFTVQLPILHAKPEFNRYNAYKSRDGEQVRLREDTAFASNTKARLDQNVFVCRLTFRWPKSDCDVDNCTSKCYLPRYCWPQYAEPELVNLVAEYT